MEKTAAEKKIRANTFILARINSAGDCRILETCRSGHEITRLFSDYYSLYEEEIKRGRYTLVIYKAQQ